MKKILIGLLALLSAQLAYADTKISALPAGATLTGTEDVPAVQSAVTVKTTPAAINTYVHSNTDSAYVISLWGGTCSAGTFLRGDGTCAAISLTANVSGILPVANGGTGVGTLTGLALGNGTSAFSAYAGTSCTNQFPRSLSAAGVATCASVANTDLANSAITINGTSTSLGGTRTLTLASADFVNQGTTTTILHGNGAGNPSFGAASLTADVTGILPAANGGTANGFTAISGPATSTKTFTLPNASATVLTSNAAVTVAQGGTGVGTLTTHGVLLGQGTGNVTAVAAMAADTVLQGQGASADPAAVAVTNCGDSTHALAYSTTTHAFSCQAVTGSGGTPGGSTTQVQFNDAGAFGGDADFVWAKTTNVLAVGSNATSGTIQAPDDATSATQGSALAIRGGIGGATAGTGGTVTIQAGASGAGGTGATGGATIIKSGVGAGTNGSAGSLTIQSGARTGTGSFGDILLNEGGGNAAITVGNATNSTNYDVTVSVVRAADRGSNGQSYSVGYVGWPNDTQNADYTLVLADRGKMILKTDSTARNYTIPPQSSVAYKIGTKFLACNANATANAVVKADNSNNRLYVTGANTTTTGLAIGAFRCASFVYMGPGSDGFEDWVGFLMP